MSWRWPIVLAVWGATASGQTTIQVVPTRAPRTTDAQAGALVKETEAALRELSNLEVRPALKSTVSSHCALDAADCWNGLGKRGQESLALVVAVDRTRPGASLALVDPQGGVIRVAQANPDGVRTAVEGLLPAQWRKGQGGLSVELSGGAKLKIDGRVVAPGPDKTLFLAAGLHEVDLLLPSGKALLTTAEVAEGRVAPLRLDLGPLREERRGASPLLWAAGGLWATGAVSIFTSLLLASIVNLEAPGLEPCSASNPTCLNFTQANWLDLRIKQLLLAAHILLYVGGGALAAGAAAFSIDLAQGGLK